MSIDTNSDLITTDVGDADIYEIKTDLGSITYAVDTNGLIYLNGDLHPGGSSQAIAEALAQDIGWINVNAVGAYFPLPWLVSLCDGRYPDRIVVMAGLERYIRGRG